MATDQTDFNDRQANVMWCKRNHAMIANGGTWMIPRSGMAFKRTYKGWELLAIMPFMVGMAESVLAVPHSARELLMWQLEDFATHQRYHKTAGLEITDPKGLLANAEAELDRRGE
jgi:hypothetical protein